MDTCSTSDCGNAAAIKGMCFKHYQASRRQLYRVSTLPKNHRIANGDPQRLGSSSQNALRQLLYSMGRTVKQMGYYDPFDFLIDGQWRCELKASKPTLKGSGTPTWLFNLHRHGKLNEDTDIYIFRLEAVPGHRSAVHLLMKAPVGKKTLAFTLRSLIETAAPMVKDFNDFCKGTWKP